RAPGERGGRTARACPRGNQPRSRQGDLPARHGGAAPLHGVRWCGLVHARQALPRTQRADPGIVPVGPSARGRRLLLEPSEVLLEELVVWLDLEPVLEGGDGRRAVALQIGDVGSVLRQERVARREALGLVERGERLVVGAPTSRLLRTRGELA